MNGQNRMSTTWKECPVTQKKSAIAMAHKSVPSGRGNAVRRTTESASSVRVVKPVTIAAGQRIGGRTSRHPVIGQEWL